MQTFTAPTINALASIIVGDNSIGTHRTGTKIERFFAACGCDFKLNNGSRFQMVHTFLCDLNKDSKNRVDLIKIIEEAADPRQFDDPNLGNSIINHLNRFLVPDGYELTIEEGKARLNNKRILKGLFMRDFFDFDTVQREVDRIIKNLSNDPEDCITAASSLVESMCRSILLEMKMEFPNCRKLTTLFKAIQGPLGLSPTKNDKLSNEMNEQIRSILMALATTSQGISALRTCTGDAHGREAGFPKIDVRIARLSVNAANTIAIFLIETWETKMKKKLKLMN